MRVGKINLFFTTEQTPRRKDDDDGSLLHPSNTALKMDEVAQGKMMMMMDPSSTPATLHQRWMRWPKGR